MADASTVAIVSVAVTGATAVAAPLVSGWLESRREQRRFEQERITKDFDELRDLLDDMTQKLYVHTREQIRLERAYSDPSSTPEADLRAEANARKTELYQLAPRLVIRLGREHPVTTAFVRCLHLIDETLARMDEMWKAGEPFEQLAYGDPHQRWDSYWEAYKGYTEAAQQLVGARLGVVAEISGVRIEQ